MSIKKITQSDLMISSLLKEKDIRNKSPQIFQSKNPCSKSDVIQGCIYKRRNAVIIAPECVIDEISEYSPLSYSETEIRSLVFSEDSTDYSLNRSNSFSQDSDYLAEMVTPIQGSLRTSVSKDTLIEPRHWTEWIPEETIKGLSKKEVMLQESIWEFITAETSFIKNLQIILHVFLDKLEKSKKLDHMQDIQPQNIFGGIEEIFDTHLRFWRECLYLCIKEAEESNSILSEVTFANNFPRDFTSHFDIYLSHCLFNTYYQEQLASAQKDDDFKKYLFWCLSQKCSNRKCLQGFLSQPMQHLMKYPLMIKAIQTHSENEESKKRLEEVRLEINGFLNDVDCRVREQEEIQIVQAINNNLDYSHFLDLSNPEEKLLARYYKLDLLAPMPNLCFTMPRILIKKGQLKMKDSASSSYITIQIYLFTDMILIAKENKKETKTVSLLKHPLALENIRVEKRTPDTFYLILLSEYGMPVEVLNLKCASAELVNSWINCIKNEVDLLLRAKTTQMSKKIFVEEVVERKRVLELDNLIKMRSKSVINIEFPDTRSTSSMKHHATPNRDSLQSEMILFVAAKDSIKLEAWEKYNETLRLPKNNRYSLQSSINSEEDIIISPTKPSIENFTLIVPINTIPNITKKSRLRESFIGIKKYFHKPTKKRHDGTTQQETKSNANSKDTYEGNMKSGLLMNIAWRKKSKKRKVVNSAV